MQSPTGKPAQQSVLAPDLEVTGNLTSTGDLLVQAKITGNISANVVALQNEASVIGDVEARKLVLSGSVEGSIVASEVALTSSGRIIGSLHYDRLAVEAGATIDGDLKRVFLPNTSKD